MYNIKKVQQRENSMCSCSRKRNKLCIRSTSVLLCTDSNSPPWREQPVSVLSQRSSVSEEASLCVTAEQSVLKYFTSCRRRQQEHTAVTLATPTRVFYQQQIRKAACRQLQSEVKLSIQVELKTNIVKVSLFSFFKKQTMKLFRTHSAM